MAALRAGEWYDWKVFAACLNLRANRLVAMGKEEPMVGTTYLQLMKLMGVNVAYRF